MAQTSSTQIIDQLHFMYRHYCRDRLQLDDDTILNQQIRTIFSNHKIVFVSHDNRSLLPH